MHSEHSRPTTDLVRLYLEERREVLIARTKDAAGYTKTQMIATSAALKEFDAVAENIRAILSGRLTSIEQLRPHQKRTELK